MRESPGIELGAAPCWWEQLSGYGRRAQACSRLHLCPSLLVPETQHHFTTVISGASVCQAQHTERHGRDAPLHPIIISTAWPLSMTPLWPLLVYFSRLKGKANWKEPLPRSFVASLPWDLCGKSQFWCWRMECPVVEALLAILSHLWVTG